MRSKGEVGATMQGFRCELAVFAFAWTVLLFSGSTITTAGQEATGPANPLGYGLDSSRRDLKAQAFILSSVAAKSPATTRETGDFRLVRSSTEVRELFEEDLAMSARVRMGLVRAEARARSTKKELSWNNQNTLVFVGYRSIPTHIEKVVPEAALAGAPGKTGAGLKTLLDKCLPGEGGNAWREQVRREYGDSYVSEVHYRRFLQVRMEVHLSSGAQASDVSRSFGGALSYGFSSGQINVSEAQAALRAYSNLSLEVTYEAVGFDVSKLFPAQSVAQMATLLDALNHVFRSETPSREVSGLHHQSLASIFPVELSGMGEVSPDVDSLLASGLGEIEEIDDWIVFLRELSAAGMTSVGMVGGSDTAIGARLKDAQEWRREFVEFYLEVLNIKSDGPERANDSFRLRLGELVGRKPPIDSRLVAKVRSWADSSWESYHEAGVRGLLGLRVQRTLKLIEAPSPSDLLRELPTARQVVANGRPPIEAGKPIIDPGFLRFATKAETISLVKCSFTSLPPLDEHCKLSDFQIEENGLLVDVSGLAKCHRIRRLVITDCPQLRSLVGLENKLLLVELNLHSNAVGQSGRTGQEIFRPLAHSPFIRDFSWSSIGLPHYDPGMTNASNGNAVGSALSGLFGSMESGWLGIAGRAKAQEIEPDLKELILRTFDRVFEPRVVEYGLIGVGPEATIVSKEGWQAWKARHASKKPDQFVAAFIAEFRFSGLPLQNAQLPGYSGQTLQWVGHEHGLATLNALRRASGL